MSAIQPSLLSFLTIPSSSEGDVGAGALGLNSELEQSDLNGFSSLFSLLRSASPQLQLEQAEGGNGNKLPLLESSDTALEADQTIDLSVMMAQLGYVVGPAQTLNAEPQQPINTRLAAESSEQGQEALADLGGIQAVEDNETAAMVMAAQQVVAQVNATAQTVVTEEAVVQSKLAAQLGGAPYADLLQQPSKNTKIDHATPMAAVVGAETAEVIDTETEAFLNMASLDGENASAELLVERGLSFDTPELKSAAQLGQNLHAVVAAAHSQTAQAKATDVALAPNAKVKSIAEQATEKLSVDLELDNTGQRIGNSLNQRIITMIKEDSQEARIHLDPPELGSLQIKLHIQHDQASIQIHAQHNQVRDMLELHAFRLKDALANEGVELSEFDVSSQGDQPTEQEQQYAGQHTGEFSVDGVSDEGWQQHDNELPVGAVRSATGMGMLDTFA